MRIDDALAALSLMPDALERRLTGLGEAELQFKPGADSFSLLENVCHLRDIEVEGYSVRLRRLLREEHPRLPDLDGTALAHERRYNEQPLAPALAAFLAARRANLELLRDVRTADLDRRGQLETVGEITLRRLLELWVEHDGGHLKELDELLAVLRDPAASKPKPSLSLSRA
jgi:hypothetical protein